MFVKMFDEKFGILDEEGGSGGEPKGADNVGDQKTDVVLPENEGSDDEGGKVDDGSFELPEFLKDVELPDDIKNEKSLLNFKSVGDLAKSYVHAKKFVGADKIVKPSKHATKEEWEGVFKQLGKPEAPDKYEIKTQEGGIVDTEFLDAFKNTAFEANLLPEQAQAVVDLYESRMAALGDTILDRQAQKDEEDAKTLKEEWGEAYDANISSAKYLVKEFGDADIIDHFKSLGVGSDAKLIKLLAKAGKALSGDGFPGVKNGTQGPLTPEDAMKQLDEIRGDFSHPYNIADHPNHDGAVKDFEKLAKYAYGVKN